MLHCHAGALQVDNNHRHMKNVLLFIIHEGLHTSEFDLCVNLNTVSFFHVSCSAPAFESLTTSKETLTWLTSYRRTPAGPINLIFPLYVCQRKRKLIYNWTVPSRRANQICLYLSFQLSWTFAFIQGKCQTGGRCSAHFSRSKRAGTEPLGSQQRLCSG